MDHQQHVVDYYDNDPEQEFTKLMLNNNDENDYLSSREVSAGGCCGDSLQQHQQQYGSLDDGHTPISNATSTIPNSSVGDNNYQHFYNTYNMETASASASSGGGGVSGNGADDTNGTMSEVSIHLFGYTRKIKLPSLRRIALRVSLYLNIIITVAKLVAYIETLSLSVLAALLDAVLDVVSQIVLNYTEKHSSMQRSSAFYPAGASRLEPIGVLTCAALMGMASFEVLKESFVSLAYAKSPFVHVDAADGTTEEQDEPPPPSMASFWNMLSIVIAKIFLLWLCNVGANKKVVLEEKSVQDNDHHPGGGGGGGNVVHYSKAAVQLADPTLEALAQDHFNDILSNGVAALALLFALRSPSLWFLDPVGAIIISIYIIYSWYMTGKEQIEHLTGKVAPKDFIEELREIADCFDERMVVDVVRAYHFGPKFLVEIEVVMPKTTLLFESHDVGMELQYEIESREEVERCFVHIDYETRPYDEHVVSKVPELREKYRPKKMLSAQSL